MNVKAISGEIVTRVNWVKKLIRIKYRQLNVKKYQYLCLKTPVLLLSGLFGVFTSTLQANPNIEGATIVNGTVSFDQPDASTLNINNSSGAIIDWEAFSIDAGKNTRFIQESANSRVLNRVTGTSSTDILGQLSSNGKVYLINPNGIVFGSNASVETAGLVASTLAISNSDFITEKDRFNGTTGKITNQANLSMSGDGNLILIAPNIENQGSLQTENGQLILAAGQSVELVSGNILFEIQASDSSALNLGELVTQRGAIDIFTDRLTQAGNIKANQAVQNADGTITLQANSSLDIQAGSTIQNPGGRVSLRSEGSTIIAGQVNTSAATAGAIDIRGNEITITGTVNASGNNAGDISIGGLLQNEMTALQDTTQNTSSTSNITITSTGAIKADALANGNGGSVSLLAENAIEVGGALSAKGGLSLGNVGGSIDAFAKQITISGIVDVSGANGGNILLGGGITSDLQASASQRTEGITITNSAAIKADSLDSGNGGSIVAVADKALRIQAELSVQGGASTGNGGSIVTAGLAELSIGVAPNVTATNGSSGNWLLTSNKMIIDVAKAGVITNALNAGSKVSVLALGTAASAGKEQVIASLLKVGNQIDVLALSKDVTGDIEVNSAISKTTGGTASLDLSANTTALNAPVTSTSGALNVGLLDASGTTGGVVNVNAVVDTNGGTLTASDEVIAAVAAAGTVDDTITEVADEATREVVAAVTDVDGSTEDTTTTSVEETSESESGAASEESEEDDDSKEDDQPEKETGSESEGKDEETNASSPPQQC